MDDGTPVILLLVLLVAAAVAGIVWAIRAGISWVWRTARSVWTWMAVTAIGLPGRNIAKMRQAGDVDGLLARLEVRKGRLKVRRRAASDALRDIGQPAIDRCIEILQANDCSSAESWSMVMDANSALVYLGEPATRAVIENLKHLRGLHPMALRSMQGSTAIAEDALWSGDAGRVGLLGTLASLGAPEACDALEFAAVHHRDPEVRDAAVDMLVDNLGPLSSRTGQRASAAALGRLADRRAIRALEHALDNRDEDVRGIAAQALLRTRRLDTAEVCVAEDLGEAPGVAMKGDKTQTLADWLLERAVARALKQHGVQEGDRNYDALKDRIERTERLWIEKLMAGRP
jgi:hypothetical protein